MKFCPPRLCSTDLEISTPILCTMFFGQLDCMRHLAVRRKFKRCEWLLATGKYAIFPFDFLSECLWQRRKTFSWPAIDAVIIIKRAKSPFVYDQLLVCPMSVMLGGACRFPRPRFASGLTVISFLNFFLSKYCINNLFGISSLAAVKNCTSVFSGQKFSYFMH